MGMYIYIYIYIHTHTCTYVYIAMDIYICDGTVLYEKPGRHIHIYVYIYICHHSNLTDSSTI